MAKNKIKRIDQEIAKVREKITEYQDKLKPLEAQKTPERLHLDARERDGELGGEKDETVRVGCS